VKERGNIKFKSAEELERKETNRPRWRRIEKER
jgi:hypothetical protein